MPRIEVPVIGIGAGPATDGQVLVFHDLLGIREGLGARFVKRYASLQDEMVAGVAAYADDVRSGRYPGPEHGYSIDESELAEFREALAGRVAQDRCEAVRDGLRVVAQLAPGEADDSVAGGEEGGVLGAVILERLAGAVGVPAVGLHDQAVRREVAVDLETWVVGGIEGDVEAGLAAGRGRVRACACALRARCG